MTWMIAILAGLLAGGGVYLMMRRQLFEVILGIGLLSQAVNVVILVSGGWMQGARPPLVIDDPAKVAYDGKETYISQVDPTLYQDPLPQALILTAIVIGFGLLSFLMVLAARADEATGSHEVGELETEDSP